MSELSFALDQLASESPQLFGTLTRVYAEHPAELAFGAKCFALALANSGRLEIDFQRSEGVSFNPRAARVALILMKDANEFSILALATTILSSIETVARESSPPPPPLDLPMLREALLLTAFDTDNLRCEFLNSPESPVSRSATLAVLCNHLDRLRHLHQAEDARLREVFPLIMKESDILLSFAAQVSAPLHDKISHWHLRVAPRLRKLVSTSD